MISSILFNLKVCSLSAKEKRSIFVKSPFNDLGPLIHRLICDKFSINVIYTHFLLLETEPTFCVCGLNIDLNWCHVMFTPQSSSQVGSVSGLS